MNVGRVQLHSAPCRAVVGPCVTGAPSWILTRQLAVLYSNLMRTPTDFAMRSVAARGTSRCRERDAERVRRCGCTVLWPPGAAWNRHMKWALS